MAFCISETLIASDQDLLLHWSFDEGSGETTKDFSENGLNGCVKAEWTNSPAGKAMLFDGTSQRIVHVDLPEEKRFGKTSWTFMAWVKPIELTIDDKQNQRRIFSFGTYPDAYLVIDLMGNGNMSCYFCYKNEAGNIISTGGSSALIIKTGEWAHLALSCNRETQQISIYVNGYCRQPAEMKKEFAGDFKLGDRLTVGCGWHNYHGIMDEVKIYRRVLSRADVKSEFHKLKEIFKATESEEAKSAERREMAQAALESGNRALASGDYATARKHYAAILAEKECPAYIRSYTHLRIAQSFLYEEKNADAKKEYARIQAETSYPEIHRFEAQECINEIDRLSKNLPSRDSSVSRVTIPIIKSVVARFHVAPGGDDANDGSLEKPFSTLSGARDAIRALRAKGIAGAVGVKIMPGEYAVTSPLELTDKDSGTSEAPIVYYAAEKGTARFYGGVRISGFKPVTDQAVLKRLPDESRDKVMQCDLRSNGISDYCELKVRGFGQPPSPPTMELYFDGKPMTLSRWPNEGFVSIKNLVEPGSRDTGKPSIIEYESDRHARWTGADDAWLFGYFHFLWADATIKIASIDTSARTITTAEPYHYGGGMNTRQGIIYYAFNLLEEIDMPGEWYLDRDSGILYFYPPSDPSKSTVEIGMMSKAMVTMKGVSNVRIEGLVFDLARYNCMHIEDSENCLVAGCTVMRMAGNGISIIGGKNNGILGCDIHTIGRRASEVIGGDRKTLTPAGHFVENCRIHFFGRIDRTYTPAIQLEGVGNRVAHNLMYNCPSSVMRIEGNDHVMEFNDVHSAVQESDDQGAMELFGNPTYRGVVFRYNQFRNVGKVGSEAAVHGQAAIRFDDAISGMLVYGNIFQRSANGNFGAIQMNSGRDNIIDNNLFIDCKQGVSGGWYPGNNVWKELRDGAGRHGCFTNSLYISRYPAIAWMLDAPAVNHLWRNVFYKCGQIATRNGGDLEKFENGVFPDTDPGFVNAAGGEFRLKPKALLFQTIGFRPIPSEEIGLYNDRYRASWPVDTTPSAIPDWRSKSH